MNVYFDNAATTRVRGEAINAAVRAMAVDYGNPSSSHAPGRQASAILEQARSSVAAALGAGAAAGSGSIVFTSGGTEANNLAISGIAQNRTLTHRGKHIITSAIEHDAVMSPIKKLEKDGFEVTYLPPDGAGRIPAESFSGALRDDTFFASIMLVNNETGAVNPVSEYAREIDRRGLGTVLHTDAVQGFCKVPLSASSIGADLISVSSHKLHGPKGAGALFIGRGVKLPPHILGGGQESGMRAGTPALPAIAGFGEAARLGYAEMTETTAYVRSLREYTAGLLKAEVPDAVVVGEGDSPFILCLSLPGFKSEVLMTFLDGEGVCVSKGAACKKGARSRTLEAMHLPDDVIDGALRVSFSRLNTRTEAEYFVSVLKMAAKTLVRS